MMILRTTFAAVWVIVAAFIALLAGAIFVWSLSCLEADTRRTMQGILLRLE